jgi:hypothetical protein
MPTNQPTTTDQPVRLAAEVADTIKPGDIPLSSGYTDADLAALLKGDDDPMQVVIEVGPGKSSRGWNYTPQALEKLVQHVNEHTLSGIMGHQREEDLGHQFVNPATNWIGAVWKDGKAYIRGGSIRQHPT